MSTNEIFNQMLSAYDLTTEQKKRNATFEVNQQIIWQDSIMADSLTRQPFMAAPAYAYSMDCNDFPRIWISLS